MSRMASAVNFEDDLPDQDGAEENMTEVGGSEAQVGSADKDKGSEYDDILVNENFDPVDYINKQFPSEQSLQNLDTFITKAKVQLFRLNRELLGAVRKQSLSAYQAEKDLERATGAIMELFKKVDSIRTAAENSEAMVEDLCRDIKQLDYAKRNLTTAITTVRRVQMLTNAVEQLKQQASQKQFSACASLLQVVQQLVSYFEQYAHIPKIKDMDDTVKNLKGKLEKSVFDEFVQLDLDGTEGMATVTPQIQGACEVIDAFGPSVRKKFIKWFVELQLRSYQMEFGRSGLSETENRFMYCQRKLRAMAGSIESVFPVEWCVPQEFAVEFCLETRKQLENALRKEENNMDVTLFMKVLRKTIEFEKQIQVKFSRDAQKPLDGIDDISIDPNVDPHSAAGIRQKHLIRKKKEALEKERREKGANANKSMAEANATEEIRQLQQAYRYTGLISSCFEPFLRIYIEQEERSMMDMLSSVLSQETWKADQSVKLRVLSSSVDTFMSIKQSLERCAAFSRGATMSELTKVFQQTLFEYSDALRSRIPNPHPIHKDSMATKLKDIMTLNSGNNIDEDEDRLTEELRLDKDGIEELCYILNTADYCYNTTASLAESILRKIEDSYQKDIDYTPQQEMFNEVSTKCIKALVFAAESECDLLFIQMKRVDWLNMAAVGDVSPWATEMSQALRDFVSKCEPQMKGTSNMRFFCDKLASWFMSRYVPNIFKCKRIGPVGAQQLLMDTQFLHSTLLKLNEGSKSYVRMIDRDMGRAESILKVLQNPLEVMVSAYRAVLSASGLSQVQVKSPTAAAPADPSAAVEPAGPPTGSSSKAASVSQSVLEFQRICELRGMKKAEYLPLSDKLERELREAAGEDHSSLAEQGMDQTYGAGAPERGGPQSVKRDSKSFRGFADAKQRFKKLFNS
eukprot:ANDGO_02798.mRNA.1 Vacuolar protein sorting-associated protein 53 A